MKYFPAVLFIATALGVCTGARGLKQPAPVCLHPALPYSD
jgi:hypothetical protein